MPRLSPADIRTSKGKRRLVTLSLGIAPLAQMADEFCDLILVGDSLAMTLYGHSSTVAVPLEVMSWHGKAVVDATKEACVIVDLPFGSYEQSPQQAFETASRILKETGAQGVKMEGGALMAPTVEFLTQRGIPVLGHIGLFPQHINMVGGFKKERDADRLIADAQAHEAAGAFGCIIEAVPEGLAGPVTDQLGIPTIGIAAGSDCDGQILVIDDLIGLNPDYVPPFVEPKARVARTIKRAIREYAKEIRED
ncbi:MAG: 3-methyl-2-oxobutanoate hydroxymethyltransferase [Alphaproteobacteria bacterium]